MAKIIDNIKIKYISKKRDSAVEKIRLNESYLGVAKNELDQDMQRKLLKKQLKAKRSLYSLEKKAQTEKESLEYKYEKALKKVNEKQRLPRLAVEQKAKRIAQAKSENEAEAYKNAQIAKLDKNLEDFKAGWNEKIENADAQKDLGAETAYNEKLNAKNKELDGFKEYAGKKAEEKFSKLKNRAEKDDIKLNNAVERYNSTLQSLISGMYGEMKNENTVLEVEDLLMQFDGLRAVDEISFEVKEGEIFGLIGPNGAGKTTVFNCITQFNKPTGGQIHYKKRNGEVIDVTKKKVHDIIKLGIVRTFQNLELIWELTVLENMLIGAHSLYGANLGDHILHSRRIVREEKIMRAKALEVLQRLGLLEYKDMIPYGLPYGILKRIELARTLMVNPRLIILDEPAAGLNEAETEELAQMIYKIRQDYNCTVFLVEHDMGLVMDICDTVCAISFGKKLAIGTPAEIQDNALVQEAYLGGTLTEDDDE